METTYRSVLEFNNAASLHIQDLPDEEDENGEKKESKLKLALEDMQDQLEPEIRKYNKRLTAIRRSHALEGKDMAILREPDGNYKYSKKGEEAVEKEIDDLLDMVIEIDITPVFVTSIPKNIPRIFLKKFKGFVIE